MGSRFCTAGDSSIPSAPSILSGFFALIFILVLIYATLRVMKFLNQREFVVRKSQNIEVVESYPVSVGVRIHLVRLCGKEIAIIEHSSAMEIISGDELGDFVSKSKTEVSFSACFGNKLAMFGKKKDKKED